EAANSKQLQLASVRIVLENDRPPALRRVHRAASANRSSSDQGSADKPAQQQRYAPRVLHRARRREQQADGCFQEERYSTDVRPLDLIPADGMPVGVETSLNVEVLNTLVTAVATMLILFVSPGLQKWLSRRYWNTVSQGKTRHLLVSDG
ncbi:unnamed protein product, partial [Ectocarpus sp. 12 AP-2014]